MNSPLQTLLLISCLGLTACQSLTGPAPAEYRRHAWEDHAGNCHGDKCPLVNIDTLDFAEEPTLNARVEQRLLQMTVAGEQSTPAASLQDYERSFLDSAEPGWSSWLQAKVLDQHRGLILLELSSYLDTGGAHGMPGRQLLQYDREAQRELQLQDLLLPGKEDAFWHLAETAHQHWLEENKLDQDPQFVEFWPFQKTTNVGLGADGAMLVYDVYAIGPYSVGHPRLNIPYAQLDGVFKPQYLR